MLKNKEEKWKEVKRKKKKKNDVMMVGRENEER